jgi:hypothetical protein
MGYNSEATKFQYDFLNDPYEYLPKVLRESIESGKKIIVLMNPPYGTATDNQGKSNTKEGISFTKVRDDMEANNVGKCREQLYAQFIYRILTLNQNNNINICMFTPPMFLTGSSYKKFRKILFSKVNFVKGFLMDSANFADVKSWGLSFTILKNIENV